MSSLKVLRASALAFQRPTSLHQISEGTRRPFHEASEELYQPGGLDLQPHRRWKTLQESGRHRPRAS